MQLRLQDSTKTTELPKLRTVEVRTPTSLRLGSCAKLAPRYCGPFEILSRIRQVAYQLALPPNLRVHNVFYISVLKKYVHDTTHVINWNDV